MKIFTYYILFSLLFAIHASGNNFVVDQNLRSGDYDLESAPSNPFSINANADQVGFIDNNSWIAYQNFNFGEGATYFWIEAGTPNVGGSIELRLGSETGQLVGTATITTTGGFSSYQEFGAVLSTVVSGVNDLYLVFKGGGGYLFDTRGFRLQTVAPGLKKVNSLFSSADFDSQSNSGGPLAVANAGVLESISSGTEVVYTDFDFREEANQFSIEAAIVGTGGKVEVRIDSSQGPLLGTLDIHHTGAATYFKTFQNTLSTSVSGVHDLYLKFIDPLSISGNLFNTRGFMLSREIPAALREFNQVADDIDQAEPLLEYAFGMHPQSRDTIPFQFDTIQPDTGSEYTGVQVRLRSNQGLQTKLLVSENLSSWDEVILEYVNGAWQTDDVNVVVREAILEGEDLFTLHLEDTRTQNRLFARLEASLVEGDIHIYPPVPGLDASPYYTFCVQKVSALNAANKEDATNWETPFAWFTKCIDYDPNAAPSAYYNEYIGSWSHTYCNFEMDENTPIVVKVTRLNKPGAPSGPIQTATVHPAHKVISCEVINGEVYVTMSQPALIAIDIDGQMDTRDAPRAIETGFSDQAFPYRNEMDAAHGVTIFANPFIEDKPNLGDPGVFAVEPGTLPPSNGTWTTLYFKPGIHRLSVDIDESGTITEREWVRSDVLPLVNNKSYYIPGDAIVYGNFNDNNDDLLSENVRVFGHGTLSGNKIPHFLDFQNLSPPFVTGDNKELRMLHLSKAANCTYEGLTITDQAEHGVYIEAASNSENHSPNIIKWVKSINWRVNNDGGGVTGNGTIEDCFFRHQDDALYVRGMAIRRTTFWSDVNGATLRCSFITHDRDENYPPTLSENLIVEDCDVIYARGVFANPNTTSFGVITTPGGFQSKSYGNGISNTAQHLIFRNIRISDPKPARYLLGFDANPGGSDPALTDDWAGIRFENVNYQNPQTWGWRNRLLGSATGSIKYWTFDDVFIGGDKLTAGDVSDPTQFETSFVSDLIFK